MNPYWREHLYAADIVTRPPFNAVHVARRLLECAASEQEEEGETPEVPTFRVPFECVSPFLIRQWASANKPQQCYQFRLPFAIVQPEQFIPEQEMYEVWVFDNVDAPHNGVVPVHSYFPISNVLRWRWRVISATPNFQLPVLNGYVLWRPWNPRLFSLCHQSGDFPVWPVGFYPFNVQFLYYYDTEEQRVISLQLPSPFNRYFVEIWPYQVPFVKRFRLLERPHFIDPRFMPDYLSTFGPHEPVMILTHDPPRDPSTVIPSSLPDVALQDPVEFTLSVFVPADVLNLLAGPEFKRLKLMPISLTDFSATLRVGKSPSGIHFFYGAEGGIKLEARGISAELLAQTQFVFLKSEDGYNWTVDITLPGNVAVADILEFRSPGTRYTFVIASDEWRVEMSSAFFTIGAARRWQSP